MRRPRITTSAADRTIDRWTQHWYVRYPLGAVLTGLMGVICVAVEPVVHADEIIVLLFAAIVASSALAGLGAGLCATASTAMILSLVLGEPISAARHVAVACEGLMVSVLGAALRSERLKSAEQLATNLRLERQIIEIGDEERRRIGHDLHDGLGQHLTGLSLLTETISQQLARTHPVSPEMVENITRLASEAVGITRDLAKSLAPMTLERDGFVAAVEELADTVSNVFGVKCDLTCRETDLLPDRTRALHLFRIIQEAVNNSIRHGKARQITISGIRKDDRVHVEIRDDGSGLSDKTIGNPGLGLRIMDYRAKMLKAELSVERASAGGGTVVTCVCPERGDISV